MVEEVKKDLKLFYCYARQDKNLRSELDRHLTSLKRQLQITSWYDGEIIPGKPWENEIKANLDTANVILLLISADFLASNYCYSVEMQRALERHALGEACVIPILIRPVYWEDEPFSKLQMLPSDAVAITRWSDRDEAYEDVARGISRAVKEWLKGVNTKTSFESKQSRAILPHGRYAHGMETHAPGCFIVLVDQSISMADPFGASRAGKRQRKSDMVASILNNFLNELITTNIIPKSDGTSDVRPRAEFAILGYGGSSVYSALGGALEGRAFVTLPELQMNPIDVDMRIVIDTDDTGREYGFEIPFPIWVRPTMGGDNTPMCAAFRRAKKLAMQWVASHQDSYPPVVINITDGPPTDGDPTELAYELCQISTSDGQTLLFNCYISTLPDPPIAYPLRESELPNDRFSRLLFSLSSVVPETSRALLSESLGRDLPPGARGLIFNGDVSSIRLMFNWQSKPNTHPLDPYR